MTTSILFSGFGGQGILFSGKFLAYDGLLDKIEELHADGKAQITGEYDCLLKVLR